MGLLGLVDEQEGEGGSAAGQAGLHCADGCTGLGRDLVDGQVAEVVQDQRAALGLGKSPQHPDESHVVGVRSFDGGREPGPAQETDTDLHAAHA